MNDKAMIPKIKNPGDVGFDLQAMEGASLKPRVSNWISLQNSKRTLETIQAAKQPRDSRFIDEGYTGEVRMILVNRNRSNNFDIAPGDRVTQIIFISALNTPFVEVQHLQETKRDNKGFSSTGIYKTGTRGSKITETKHSIPIEEDKHSYRMVVICLIENKGESKN